MTTQWAIKHTSHDLVPDARTSRLDMRREHLGACGAKKVRDKQGFKLNSIGAKRFGEAAMTALTLAIGDAVQRAAARGLRDLPFRIEHLF